LKVNKDINHEGHEKSKKRKSVSHEKRKRDERKQKLSARQKRLPSLQTVKRTQRSTVLNMMGDIGR
jgi:hypothetical protein